MKTKQPSGTQPEGCLVSIIVMLSEATRMSLHALLIARYSMLHVLSATRAAQLACACRYCCWMLHTATTSCLRLPYIMIDAFELFGAAATSRRGADSS